MAHFALIDENNIVQDIIVIDNNDCGGGDFPESEKIGQEFISNELGLQGLYLQTSYNNNFRDTYAGIGYEYDSISDIFVAPVIDEGETQP